MLLKTPYNIFLYHLYPTSAVYTPPLVSVTIICIAEFVLAGIVIVRTPFCTATFVGVTLAHTGLLMMTPFFPTNLIDAMVAFLLVTDRLSVTVLFVHD